MNLVIDINVAKHLHNGLIVLNFAILLPHTSTSNNFLLHAKNNVIR